MIDAATLVSVADVEPPSYQALRPGFECDWRGERVRVTAVLDLTVVVEDRHCERHVVNKRAAMVDPATLIWEPAPPPRSFQALRLGGRGARQSTLEAAERGRAKARVRYSKAALTCTRCGAAVGDLNKLLVCTACRSVCPICGGRKGANSLRCVACARAGRAVSISGSREE